MADLDLDVFEVLALADLVFEAMDFDFLVVIGCLIMLTALGVGKIDQYHLPLAKAQV